MIQHVDAITQKLEESLEDEIFSRKEKKEISELIQVCDLDEHELRVLRARAFDLARKNLNDGDIHQLMDWLEKVQKSLLPRAPTEASCEVFFSPSKSSVDAINSFLKRARQTLRICVFTISDNRISEEIIQVHRKGIKVQVLTDDDKSEDLGSDIEKLFDEGIEVRMDDSPAHMHHKFAVCDDREVLTGSYNWTRSAAWRNNENFMITDHEEAVERYLKHFDYLWNEMVPYDPRKLSL